MSKRARDESDSGGGGGGCGEGGGGGSGGEWVERMSTKYGREYWFNEATGRSVWQDPALQQSSSQPPSQPSSQKVEPKVEPKVAVNVEPKDDAGGHPDDSKYKKGSLLTSIIYVKDLILLHPATSCYDPHPAMIHHTTNRYETQKTPRLKQPANKNAVYSR